MMSASESTYVLPMRPLKRGSGKGKMSDRSGVCPRSVLFACCVLSLSFLFAVAMVLTSKRLESSSGCQLLQRHPDLESLFGPNHVVNFLAAASISIWIHLPPYPNAERPMELHQQ